MTRHQKAIVIGCGIGGPVVAMALARAGIEPVIHEAHEGSADGVGSFLNVASNGLDALRAVGVDARALEGAFPTPRMILWSGAGKRLGEVANGLALADGTVSVTIERGLLHRALRDEALRRGVRIERGKRLEGARALPEGGVVATFEDGTEARDDLLVGADGLHSRVRRAIEPSAPAPRDTGQLSIGGVARATRLEPTPGAYHMIFGKRAFFGYSVRPGGDAYWFANVAASAAPPRDALEADAVVAWKERLTEIFRDDAGHALAMIGATERELCAHSVFDMPTVPVWHRGPMVLLGDAAHATSPSSGQGASMAIEDAIVLGKCLRDLREHEHAFAAYERLRRERVERVVRYSASVTRTKVAGPIGRVVRDLAMPLALRVFASSRAHAWLYEHHVDWHERVAGPVHEPARAIG